MPIGVGKGVFYTRPSYKSEADGRSTSHKRIREGAICETGLVNGIALGDSDGAGPDEGTGEGHFQAPAM